VKLLVLGANGQVGFELARSLAPLGDVVAATREGADLGNSASLANALDDAKADIIVNAAAYTAVDRAEDEPALADRINHIAVGEIGAWAASHGARVIHYSTDYVFDGRATRPYREDDPTAPLGVYGRSKLAGEDALRASGASHLIVRTAWVYASRGQNFLRTMLRLGAEREEMRIVADQIGSPTPARAIADATAAALREWRGGSAGTYHLVSAGQCSWFDFASAIFKAAADRGLIAREPRVVPIVTADYPTRARRPAYSALDCSRLKTAFGIQLPDWRAGLESVFHDLAAKSSP